MLLHLSKLLGIVWGAGLEPAVGEECGWGGEDGGVAVHGPCLGCDDGAWREGVAHEVEGLIGRAVLGRAGGDDAFEEAGGWTMDTKTCRGKK